MSENIAELYQNVSDHVKLPKDVRNKNSENQIEIFDQDTFGKESNQIGSNQQPSPDFLKNRNFGILKSPYVSQSPLKLSAQKSAKNRKDENCSPYKEKMILLQLQNTKSNLRKHKTIAIRKRTGSISPSKFVPQPNTLILNSSQNENSSTQQNPLSLKSQFVTGRTENNPNSDRYKIKDYVDVYNKMSPQVSSMNSHTNVAMKAAVKSGLIYVPDQKYSKKQKRRNLAIYNQKIMINQHGALQKIKKQNNNYEPKNFVKNLQNLDQILLENQSQKCDQNIFNNTQNLVNLDKEKRAQTTNKPGQRIKLQDTAQNELQSFDRNRAIFSRKTSRQKQALAPPVKRKVMVQKKSIFDEKLTNQALSVQKSTRTESQSFSMSMKTNKSVVPVSTIQQNPVFRDYYIKNGNKSLKNKETYDMLWKNKKSLRNYPDAFMENRSTGEKVDSIRDVTVLDIVGSGDPQDSSQIMQQGSADDQFKQTSQPVQDRFFKKREVNLKMRYNSVKRPALYEKKMPSNNENAGEPKVIRKHQKFINFQSKSKTDEKIQELIKKNSLNNAQISKLQNLINQQKQINVQNLKRDKAELELILADIQKRDTTGNSTVNTKWQVNRKLSKIEEQIELYGMDSQQILNNKIL